jgi:hypothetical protein
MARKAGQLIARGQSTWLIRVYLGHHPQSGTRRYYNQTLHTNASAAAEPVAVPRCVGSPIRKYAETMTSGRRMLRHSQTQNYSHEWRVPLAFTPTAQSRLK